MPSLSLIRTFCREIFVQERSERVAEPDLVMDDPEKVAAYTRAGREDGVMAPVYLFHAAQICDVIRSGDRVVDLGCGPATQLAMVARLNPLSQFIGVDLSPQMLARARAYVAEQSLDNVSFEEGSITQLSAFADNSVDAVISTVALHHLPDKTALEQTFSEIGRVLKPDGGIYVVDFGHLKSEKSIQSFAYQYADRQAELFTLDYLYSLRAAFTLEDFRSLARQYLNGRARVYSTFGMPYMMAVKSAPRTRRYDQTLITKIRALRDNLPDFHRRDLSDLIGFFRMGGLASPLLKLR